MNEVFDFLTNEAKIKYGDSLVIACSGGPDSMALLYIVNKLKKNLDIEVVCAHVNHNIRQESADEKTFVENFCKKNNIKFEFMVIEEYGDDNFHNEARTKRYAFFEEVIKKYHSKWLLTAHHGDDLMETILMRIVRGSTLKGYSGFGRIVNHNEYTIIRPLINVSKEEIIEFNKDNKIKYVSDKSNLKDTYTRNRFRKYIVSEIKKEDDEVNKKFYKFSKTLLEYNDYIEKTAQDKLKGMYPQNILQIEKFLKEETIIQKKIIQLILEKFYLDDLMLITDTHTNLIHNLIKSKKANITIHLPNNVKVIKAYNTLTLALEEQKAIDYEIELIDYINLPNGKNLQVIKESDSNSNNICRLNSNNIKLPLHVRNRKDGDRMIIKGMLSSKKIKDIFIDSKVPLKERDTWPIVVDALGNIVWLPGLKKSHFDRTKKENYDIIVKYY